MPQVRGATCWAVWMSCCFSFLQMVSAICMSTYVSATVWESESLPAVLMEVIALNTQKMPLLLLTLVLKCRNQPGTTYSL